MSEISPRDLTLSLPKRRVDFDIWSSDTLNFLLPNTHVKTTLDNTVLDVLELISKRSNDVDGILNTGCLKLKFKNEEHEKYEPLSNFLIQEDHIRIQVLINTTRLGSSSIRPALMNINLKLSSGRTIYLSEPINTSIREIKYSLAEKLHIGIDQIRSLKFNGNEEIVTRDDTLGDILNLDIAPLGDLNIHVGLISDFIVKLSTPSEHILRTDTVNVTGDTTISTIKEFILDQYTKVPNSATVDDIKIIYLGRALSFDDKIIDISPNLNKQEEPILTLHFMLKELDDSSQNIGFWDDLKRGSFFEFLPREPNPNFEAEVQRDERLREQLRNGSSTTARANVNIPTSSDRLQPLNASNENQTVSATVPQPTHSTQVPQSGHLHNSPPAILDEFHFTGHSLDVIRTIDGDITRDQLATSTTFYTIKLNTIDGTRTVSLSSSQAIINKTDPTNPYLMLSPSGFAALRSLGVSIHPPTIIKVQNTALGDNTSAHATREGNANIGAPLNNAPVQRLREFRFRLNLAGVLNVSIIHEIFKLLRYGLFYSLMIYPLPLYYRFIATLIFAVYVTSSHLTLDRISSILRLFAISEPTRNRIVESLRHPFGLSADHLRGILKGYITNLLRRRNHPTNGFIRFIGKAISDTILFFTSIFQPLHDIFLEVIHDEYLAREERLRQSQETEPAQVDIEPIAEVNGATGAQPHRLD